MSHSRLFSLSISCNTITVGVSVRDDDAAGDIPQRPCLVCEFTSGHDVPRTGEICCGNSVPGDCRLCLIGLKSKPVNEGTADDTTSQRQSNGIHHDRSIFEIANKLRR